MTLSKRKKTAEEAVLNHLHGVYTAAILADCGQALSHRTKMVGTDKDLAERGTQYG